MSTTYDPSSIPDGFAYYDTDQADHPLLITHETAKEIGATLHQPVEGKAGRPASVKDILAQVGDDPNLASAALEAEQATTSPRKSLVAALEAVVGAAEA